MAKANDDFFADTKPAKPEPLEVAEETPSQAVLQGRRERRNSLFDKLNKLNGEDKKWKYTLGERFKSDEGYDGVDRLLEDGYEVLPKEDAKAVLGIDLRGHHVILRIARPVHELYVREAIEEATERSIAKTPEGNAVVKMTEAKSERRLVSISGT